MSSNSYKLQITRETNLVDWIWPEKNKLEKKAAVFSNLHWGISRFVQPRNETGDYVPGGLGTLGPDDGVGGLNTVLGLVAPVIIEGKEYRARNAVSYVYRNISS